MQEFSSKSQYLEHLKNFNDNKGKVVLNSDVKNEKGVLLAARGERLSEKNVDLMIRHKLLKPLDDCIGLEPAFTAKSLKQAFEDTLAIYPDIHKIAKSSSAMSALSGSLHHMEQFNLLYQKLTIMAHVLPDHFERSIIKSTLALSLSIYSEQPKADCIKIFYISLIENIGYLHIDHRILDTETPPLELWRPYHAHPLVARELLKSISGLPPSIIRGVAEHHERIDGTGFPAMKAQTEMSTYVPYTGLVDEFTRLMFAGHTEDPLNPHQLIHMLQFRRKYFPNQLYADFQSMIKTADIPPNLEELNGNIQACARLQHYLYAKCMIYCDVIARVTDAVSTDSSSKSLVRLHTLSANFISGAFESGMLSAPIHEFIQECMTSDNTDYLSDMIDLDHAHNGILDQINEIFLFLEYALKHETHPEEILESNTFASLQACFAILQHIKAMENNEEAWRLMIENMYDGNNELSAIINSMR